VENLTFPCKLEVHENVMTTTNGAIIIKSCLKRIDMNDKSNRTTNYNNNNKNGVNKNSLNSSNDRTNGCSNGQQLRQDGMNGGGVMIGVDQVDRCVVADSEGDPYTELEIYLEKVKVSDTEFKN
jgi:hypothetical protein